MAILNLDFYSGEDLYSDGDIENEIMEIIQEKKIEETLESDTRWPIVYHLSKEREWLLDWYPFKDNSTCLEIGGGCGAITGLFAKIFKQVTVVELSKRRAEICYNRHEACDNVEIYASDIYDFKNEIKYDYVTLIGVLEYIQNPKGNLSYIEFLTYIKKKFLKAGGTLIIAIENQYGMKYFAGVKEDHVGVSYSGIEGYLEIQNIRTFSRYNLQHIISKSGYEEVEFYYPYPDYKFCKSIHSDKYLPKANELFAYNRIDQESYTVFDEIKAMNEAINNEMYPVFANSFLVFCK